MTRFSIGSAARDVRLTSRLHTQGEASVISAYPLPAMRLVDGGRSKKLYNDMPKLFLGLQSCCAHVF